MKTLARILALVAFLITCLASPQARGSGSQVAVVTGIIRGLEMKPAGGSSWLRATVWMPLRVGDALRTAEGQQASVMMADTSQVKLDSNTEVVVRGYTLEAKRGHVWLLVQGNRKPYRVTTPNAVAGIEGTELEIEASASNTTLRVVHGSVLLSNSAGSSERVQAMSECFVSGGSAPSSPRRLDPKVLAWVQGAEVYTESKIRVEKNIASIMEEARAVGQDRGKRSPGQMLPPMQALLQRLNVEIAAFASLEPPPLFVLAHAHRLLALDLLSVALRELEAGVINGTLREARPRAASLLSRARAENAVATRQYENFSRVYEQVVARLERPDGK